VTDLTRALLLPEVFSPSPSLLKTLALYWDEVVLVDYTERLMADDPPASRPRAQTELEDAGLLRRVNRSLKPPGPPPWLADAAADALSELPLSPEQRETAVAAAMRGDVDDQLLSLALMPSYEARRVTPNPQRPWDDLTEDERQPLLRATRHMLESLFRLTEEHYVARVLDACNLAALNGWGPVSGSTLSAVASALGARHDDLPLAEAALISVTAEAFAVDGDTPVDEIVALREQHRSSMQRLRASLVDLSASVSVDGTPSQIVNRARGTFTDRVLPSLGDLESILTESKVKFFLRSLLGAVTYAIPPHDPVRGIAGGLRVTSEIIDYRFSRETLLGRHPYGYLHHVSDELGASPSAAASSFLETQRDPMKVFARLFDDREVRAAAIREVLGFDVTT
jgi:hypothetical protein